MTDTALLKKKIEESGISQQFICEKLGISRYTWYRKRDGLVEFKASEIQKVCDMLNITSLRERSQIFFAKM